jgi:hypothetical protein
MRLRLISVAAVSSCCCISGVRRDLARLAPWRLSCDRAFAIKCRVTADRGARGALGKPLGPAQLVIAGEQIIRTCRRHPPT